MAALGALLAVLVNACAAPARETPAAPVAAEAPRAAVHKKVTAAIRGDPPTLSEKLSRVGAGRVYGVREMEQLVHVGLLVEDDNVELRPVLAEAVPTVENGLWKVLPDGRMETTWVLRPNTAWHDGVPFTSGDLAFTALVAQDKQLTEFGDVAFDYVEAVETPDARTVVVKWQRPFIWANSLFSVTRGLPHPRHLMERPYLDDKAAYVQNLQWSEAYVGAGAFKLRELVRGSHAMFDAFDGFVLGRPQVDEIEVKFLQDANALAANILTGLVDLTLIGQGSLSIEQALQIRDQWPQGKLIPVLSGTVGAFPQFINPNPPIQLDAHFRRALLYAVDRQLMVDSLQAGLSQVAHTHFTPLNAEYKDIQDSIVRYAYDPRQASQMIEALGYSRGGDGIFRDAANQRLALELRSTPGREVNDKTTFIVADNWQQVGVGVDTLMIPLQRNNDREYRQTRPAFEVVGTPDDVYRLHSSQIPTAETRFVGDNRPRYASPELDSLIDRYYVTIPRAERVQVFGQIIHHITDQVVQMSFFYEAGPMMISNRLQRVTSVPTWNPWEWNLAS